MSNNNLKFCKKCQTFKPLECFDKDKYTKTEYAFYCKECKSIYAKNKYNSKLNHLRYIKNCEKFKSQQRLMYKRYPYKRTLVDIKQRCNNPNNKDYKYYGRRGIKCKITINELKKLWFRDKAYNMKRPSIDRIDNDGNYSYANCRYIEQSENTVKSNKRGKL